MTVSLQQLRRTIERSPEGAGAAIVTRRWLQEVERDLTELARIRAAKVASS